MLKNNARNQFAAQLFTFLSVVFFFTTIAFAADGGLFKITVEKSPQNPIVGITVYLFNDNGSYLGLNQATDSSGIAAFNLAEGTYKARADYLGYQFWSDATLVTANTNILLPITHQDVTLTVEGDYLGTEPLEGVPVFLFTAAGTYMNQNLTTDVNGQVVFSLPEQAYTVRADYMAQQYWSDEFNWQDATVTVPMADAEIQVAGSGLSQEGVNIYVYTASGTYLGLTATSDASGTVNFRLAAGNYKFRADYQSSQYWSSDETLNTGQVNPVVINTGGGVFSFTLLKEANDYLVGVNCYVFNEAGTYLGMTGVTSNEGLVSFNLAGGNYKFRVDYLEYEFWSRIYTVPDTLSTSLTIPHQDVTVTVEGNYQAAEPLAGVPVYLFTKAGTYMNQTQSTDAAGQVVFNLPEQPYKVRADYHSQQYWSAEFTWQDTAVTVPMAEAAVQVTSNGLPLEGINVYVFSASGVYLNLVEPTDTSGIVTFRLPADTYKFRADYQSSQYWSADETLTADQVNPVGISTGGGEFSFTVFKGVNDHLAGINCYVFNGVGTYLGMTDVTSSEGQVTFNLADGDYKFRTDYLGYQFWSAVYTVPDTLTATLTIPHQDVTVTVEGNYQAAEPLAGVPVYLFTETGTYMNQIQSTNAAGQVVFNLPEQPYMIRADYLAQQYWSAEFTWQDTAVTVPMAEAAVQVTSSGLPLEGINVYVFSASGVYLNLVEPTDASGTVAFRLPASTYKFRADYQASQYWSSEETLATGQVSPVGISTGGGVFSFTVLRAANDPLAGVNCYVFNEAGTYLGMTEITSSEGLVTFNLADGNYKLRVDYLGYQFWSPVYTVPDTLTATLTVPHQDVTVTIVGNYQTAEPLAGVPAYLFTDTGTYMNQNHTTDTAGQVVFSLPEQSYKVRANYLGQQFWSASFQPQDTTVTINQGLAGIHVTRSGSDVAGAKVYLFSENDAYLGWFETTDESGRAEFLLPDRSFKFRVDEGADQQWTPVVVITAGVLNNIEVDISPISVNISADPEIITAGGSLTLTWNSTNASTCAIEPGIGTVEVSGSISVTPSETTTYTITATGIGGSATDSITVTVTSPPSFSETKLTISDAVAYDNFGKSVSISGDYAIVSAFGEDDAGSGSGSAYIFKREGVSWNQQAKLTADDAATYDNFGSSVAIDGDYAIVGAHYDDDSGSNSGSAYIFKRDGTSWSQQAKLTADDAAAADIFGSSVSINGDYVVVGAYGDDDGGSSSGSAYIFKRDGTIWSQQGKLTAIDSAASEYFGKSVSISGDYVIVGAYGDDDGGSRSGSAYIFKRDDTSWLQQAKLTAIDASAYDYFGLSVSISGDYAIMGAYGDDDGGSISGSAYIFKRDGTSWSQQIKLTATDPVAYDYFGMSVSINGEYAIVGAAQDEEGSQLGPGSAYIFKLQESTWNLYAKLGASDGENQDSFGISVGISGHSAIVGAYGDDDGGNKSGAAYIYSSLLAVNISGDPSAILVGESSTLTWNSNNADTCFIEPGIGGVALNGSIIVTPTETTTYTITATGSSGSATDSVTIAVNPLPSYTEFKLTAEDAAASDNFGRSVSISGGYAIVGADGYGNDGSAYIFKRDGTGWAQQAKLTASNATDGFGTSISISGDYAIVGAGGDDAGGSNSGSAYIFERDGTSWYQQAKLTADDAAEYDYFGGSVFISGDYAIVGAYGDDDDGSSSGSAYIFKRDGTSWSQQAKLNANDAAENDRFGNSVSISGDYAIAGADSDDDDGNSSGSAYIFKRDGTSWIQQAKLTAGDAAESDAFGNSVSISGDYAIVGALLDDDGGSNSGSAYIFKRDGLGWNQDAKLTASLAQQGDVFGCSVSIDGNYAIVGARAGGEDGGAGPGTAYIFDLQGSSWVEREILRATDGADYDLFGFSVGISSAFAIVGAMGDDDNGDDSGSAYIYQFLPTVTVNSDPEVILIGESSMLTWSSTNAHTCVIEPGIGTVDINGAISVSPSETTTYTISATGPRDTVTDSVAVFVYDASAPISVSAAIDPGNILLGESSTFTWSSSNATSVVIDPGIGNVDLNGTIAISPVETTTYTITATNPVTTATETVTVTMTSPPHSVGISADPANILLGGSTTLIWSSKNAATCSIEPGIGSVDVNGSLAISPSQTTTYTITATNPWGTANSSVMVVIVSPPPSINFSADPVTIYDDESAILTWQTQYADSVSIEPDLGSQNVNGSIEVTPAATTMYTLTASGAGGTSSRTATITVNRRPGIYYEYDALGRIIKITRVPNK